MNRKITVLSRTNFQKLVDSLSDRQIEASAFITVNEMNRTVERGSIFEGSFLPVLPTSDNVLNLWFDDADEQLPLLNGEPLILFNEQMAQDIVRFVLRNSDKKAWFIHCTMGKCRSGAIGEVLSDFFDIPYDQFKRTNPQVQPNVLVKRLLTNAFQSIPLNETELSTDCPIENSELWDVCLNGNKNPELFLQYLQIQREIFEMEQKVQEMKRLATEIANKLTK